VEYIICDDSTNLEDLEFFDNIEKVEEPVVESTPPSVIEEKPKQFPI